MRRGSGCSSSAGAWLCPSCGGVVQAGGTLKTVDRREYRCAFCALDYEPTLDEVVEVTFTVNPRFRRIAAHDPDSLPIWEHVRQLFWGTGLDLPADGAYERTLQEGDARGHRPAARRESSARAAAAARE